MRRARWQLGVGGGWAFGAALCVLASSAGCFYYDSTWGQARTAQQNTAQQMSGAQLGSKEGGEHRLPPRAAALQHQRIVAFATPQHAAEIVNWQARFREAVDRANQVLGPVLGLELEAVAGGSWRPEQDGEHLEPLLAELERTHGDVQAQWVVGLVGSLTRLEPAFHEIGVSRVHGKYMVIRAANDALEFDAIEHSFTELGTEERAALYRSRRAHQASAVLIHELGHCLGAVHVSTPTDLMHSIYDSSMSGLDDAVVRVLRISLEERGLPAEQRSPAHLAAALENAFAVEPAPWDPQEKAEMLAYLAQLHAAPAPARATASSVGTGALPLTLQPDLSKTGGAQLGLAELSEADRALYDLVVADKSAGRLDRAWAAGQPLFQGHSDVRPIAELRCQLAMDQKFDWSQTQQECAALMKQTGAFQR